MNLVVVDLDKEPDCLKKLYQEGKHYEDLKGECRKLVLDALNITQKGYCVYCEQKFSIRRSIYIEHYIPQSVSKSLELFYGNFFGVCSGKFYLDRMKGTHIEHCDTSRKSTKLRIDPRLPEHINELFYDDDGSIRSENAFHDEDLNNTLNLNFDEFKQKRNEEFSRNFSNILEISSKIGLSKKDSLKQAIQALEMGKSEFNSYLRYRYTKLLNAIL